MNMRKVLYIDLDNVLVAFESALPHYSKSTLMEFEGRLDEIPGIFAKMIPLPGAVESFNVLADLFDTYILSTSPWENPSAWSDKLIWVKDHLGNKAYKRLILSHHKNLARGDFLIDDRTKNGVDKFVGEHILFGSHEFPNWQVVVQYLRVRAA